jgi:hypothetical protein
VVIELQSIRDSNLVHSAVADEATDFAVDFDYWFPIAA